MGITSSQTSRNRKSSSSLFHRRSSELTDVSRKINEKECVFIAMQAEIEKSITKNNKESMKSLSSEIFAHIVDLHQLKEIDMPYTERQRTQRLVYNFEISLAKLQSIQNSDTAIMKKVQASSETSQFYTNNVDPDIVSDLVRAKTTEDRGTSSYSHYRVTSPSLEGNDNSKEHSTLTRHNSLYSKQSQSIEDIINSIESEFEVLKDLMGRSVETVEEYYQMDKGVFYLQVRLKNTEIPPDSPLNERKLALHLQLVEFRSLLDKKSAELEEQRDLTQEVNTLELLVDSATRQDLDTLKSRAMIFQETIEKTCWDQQFLGKKIELLRRLAAILARIGYSTSPTTSLRDSVEHLYENLNSLQNEMDSLGDKEVLESIESIDRVLQEQLEYTEEAENNEETIYGNLDAIEQYLHKNEQEVNTQRGTVYVNADIINQSSGTSKNKTTNREIINKRPLPLPRNVDEKIISDLTKNFQRLNEILDKDSISDTDMLEVMEIQRHAEVARTMFERKINRIIAKSEESIDL